MAARTFAPRSVTKTAFDTSMLKSARMVLTTCFMFANQDQTLVAITLHELLFVGDIMDRYSDVAHLLV